jgi:hypothetical protein
MSKVAAVSLPPLRSLHIKVLQNSNFTYVMYGNENQSLNLNDNIWIQELWTGILYMMRNVMICTRQLMLHGNVDW